MTSRRVWGAAFALILLAAGLSRAIVWEPFRIPSESMLPTLLVGDHLIVNRWDFGARLPFSDARLPPRRAPERGEVVVFEVAIQGEEIAPADRQPDWPRRGFVKRIVGMPGERIDLVDGIVFVDGEPIPMRLRGEGFRDTRERDFDVQEVEIGTRRFRVLEERTRRAPRRSWQVEPGRYFLLGDHRDHSRDSRHWGTVSQDDLIGPVTRLYWSWALEGEAEQRRVLWKPSDWWRAQIRWERMGMRIR